MFSGSVPACIVEVTGSRFIIGRGEDCDLVLEDSKVSRHHAVIVPGRGPFRFIRDLDSANGTLVDGCLVRAPVGFATSEVKETELSGTEWLQFGDTVARVTLADPGQIPSRSETGTKSPSPAPQGDPGPS